MPGFWQQTFLEPRLGTQLVFLLSVRWGKSHLLHGPHSPTKAAPSRLSRHLSPSMLMKEKCQVLWLPVPRWVRLPRQHHLTGHSEPIPCLWPSPAAPEDLRHPWCSREAGGHCCWWPRRLLREGAVLLCRLSLLTGTTELEQGERHPCCCCPLAPPLLIAVHPCLHITSPPPSPLVSPPRLHFHNVHPCTSCLSLALHSVPPPLIH